MARTCLGGLTLLLALTLSVRGVAVSSSAHMPRPAMVQAMVRFLAAASETPDVRERQEVAGLARASAPASPITLRSDADRHEDAALLRERLNLPPPARA